MRTRLGQKKHVYGMNFIRNVVYTAYGYNQENLKKFAPYYYLAMDRKGDFDQILRNEKSLPWTHETFKEILKAHSVPINQTQSPKGQLEDFCKILAYLTQYIPRIESAPIIRLVLK